MDRFSVEFYNRQLASFHSYSPAGLSCRGLGDAVGAFRDASHAHMNTNGVRAHVRGAFAFSVLLTITKVKRLCAVLKTRWLLDCIPTSFVPDINLLSDRSGQTPSDRVFNGHKHKFYCI